MASLLLRGTFPTIHRITARTGHQVRPLFGWVWGKDADKDGKHVTFPHQMEFTTGFEKVMLMLQQRGIDDPFDMQPLNVTKEMREKNSKDNPFIIKAFEPKRLIGCICEPDATVICWMWVHKGDPRRCECGYWIKVVDADDHFAMIQKEIDKEFAEKVAIEKGRSQEQLK